MSFRRSPPAFASKNNYMTNRYYNRNLYACQLKKESGSGKFPSPKKVDEMGKREAKGTGERAVGIRLHPYVACVMLFRLDGYGLSIHNGVTNRKSSREGEYELGF